MENFESIMQQIITQTTVNVEATCEDDGSFHIEIDGDGGGRELAVDILYELASCIEDGSDELYEDE